MYLVDVKGSPLRRDKKKEHSLWANKPSASYSVLRYDPSAADPLTGDDSSCFTAKNDIDINDIYKWSNIAKKLNGSYIAHKNDNYSLMAPVKLCSIDPNPETQRQLQTMKTWDVCASLQSVV